jgi:hypothetical protein
MITRILFLITLLMLLGLAGPARGQKGAGPWSAIAGSAAEEEKADDLEGKIGGHYQLGAFYRFAGSTEFEDKQTFLFTGDLVWLRWSRQKSTFGGGVHFAIDDTGHRIGLKGLWRTPLKKGTWNYFQLAPGVFVSGTDNAYDFAAPSFFLEAEWGVAREFALVLAAEFIRYENRWAGWEPDGTSYFGTPVYEDGMATSFYLGAKVGQKPAVGVTLVGLLVLIGGAIAIGAQGGIY